MPAFEKGDRGARILKVQAMLQRNPRGLTVAEIARIIWAACGRDPSAFRLKHLESFEVDVQRRWPSVEKARQKLGWEAGVDLRNGIDDTVRWLRNQTLAAATAESER